MAGGLTLGTWASMRKNPRDRAPRVGAAVAQKIAVGDEFLTLREIADRKGLAYGRAQYLVRAWRKKGGKGAVPWSVFE